MRGRGASQHTLPPVSIIQHILTKTTYTVYVRKAILFVFVIWISGMIWLNIAGFWGCLRWPEGVAYVMALLCILTITFAVDGGCWVGLDLGIAVERQRCNDVSDCNCRSRCWRQHSQGLTCRLSDTACNINNTCCWYVTSAALISFCCLWLLYHWQLLRLESAVVAHAAAWCRHTPHHRPSQRTTSATAYVNM